MQKSIEYITSKQKNLGLPFSPPMRKMYYPQRTAEHKRAESFCFIKQQVNTESVAGLNFTSN